ncbi:hypothetical protein [Fructilactobacillus sanfranciscensis]|uniref:hypothetical protein n=1 Tax=Fructilactobacillus sanfranciscensis TaxID=1625 RepID=UPI001CDCAFEC|nr:hypothetical protein [Fructilactobacillus sanfranciscensis]
MIIFLHALVGMVAFIGAGALGTSFSGQINQLSTLQKWSLITTVTTIDLTAVLGTLLCCWNSRCSIIIGSFGSF